MALHRPLEGFCSFKAIPLCHIKKNLLLFHKQHNTEKTWGDGEKQIKQFFMNNFAYLFIPVLLLNIVLYVQSTNQCCEIRQYAIMKNLRTQFKGGFI